MDNPDNVPVPPTQEEVPVPVIGQSPTYEASVQRWRLGLYEGTWYAVPSSSWGLFTQFQALGAEAYKTQFSEPDWETYRIDGPGSIYFRDPEPI